MKQATMNAEKELSTEEKLREQVAELKGLIEELKAGDKAIGKVIAGPFATQNTIYARVDLGGGTHKVVNVGHSLLFSEPKEISFVVGDEVVCLESNIVDVIPRELKPKEKAVKKLKLTAWEDIGGYGSQINRIRDAVEAPLKNKKLAAKFGVEPLKGAVLYGPPGCGKTLIAKALASTLLELDEVDERAFVYIKGPEILSQWVSVAEQRVARMFEACRSYFEESGNQAVIFIDEADAILNRRGSRHSSDVDQTIVPAFLSEMDGLYDGNPFVLLATNRLASLDPAILREGRIDLKIEITRPDLNDIADIFGIHLRSVKIAEDCLTLARLGADAIGSSLMHPNRSGAMVKTVVKLAAQNAMLRYARDKHTEYGVTANDLTNSINSIQYVPTDSIA